VFGLHGIGEFKSVAGRADQKRLSEMVYEPKTMPMSWDPGVEGVPGVEGGP